MNENEKENPCCSLLSPLSPTIDLYLPGRWKSYTAPEKTVLMTNVQDSVFQLFQRVENKHGWMLVSHALAYVTAVSLIGPAHTLLCSHWSRASEC